MKLTVVGLSLLMAVAMVTAEEKMFMALFPKELRNGMYFTPDIILATPASSNMNIYVSIRKYDSATSELAFPGSDLTVPIELGETQGTASVMVPFDLPTGMQYYVHFAFPESFGLTEEVLPVKVIVYRPALPLFIITDKPIYNPGQEVLFKGISCDENLRPTKSTLIFQIKDSNQRLLMNETSKTNDEFGEYSKALVDGSFTLSDNPVLGMYTITLNSDVGYTSSQFEVKKYVLPTYEVILEVDQPYLIDGDDTVSGRIRGIYSYGQPVIGKASLKIATGYADFSNIEASWKDDSFSGSALFTAKVKTTSWEMPYYRSMYVSNSAIKVRAELQEANTDNVMSAEVSVTIYAKPIGATIMKPLPTLFQGNTEYKFWVKLTNPQGGPLTDWDSDRSGSDNLSHYVLRYKSGSDRDYMETAVTSNPQEVTVKLNTSDDSLNENQVEAYYKYTKTDGSVVDSQYARENVAKYYTYSKETVKAELVSSSNENQRCFKLTPFQAGDKAYYQVVNNYYPEPLQDYTNTDGHCFTLEQKHAPKSRILVYRTADYTDGKLSGTELLTAFVDVAVEWTPEQTVLLTVPDDAVEPGEMVDIEIKTDGQAYVGYKAVDKSVSFMADANDLSMGALGDSVMAFSPFDRKKDNPNPNPPIFPMPFLRGPVAKRKKRCSACISSDKYMDSRKSLENAGLFIVTNFGMKRHEDFASVSRGDYPEYVAMAMPDMMYDDFDEGFREKSDGALEEAEDSAKAGDIQTEEEARDEFPETWVWGLKLTNSDGVLKVKEKAPDTITKWVVSAFGINHAKGLSVSETKEVTVFQEMFIKMDLPYSVVRTELVDIDILVYNYKSEEIKVTVDLEETSNFTIKDGSKLKKPVAIPSGNSVLVTAKVEFTKIGDIPLKVTAREVDSNNVDIVVRRLPVLAEGREIREDDNVQVTVSEQSNSIEQTFNMSKFFQEPGFVDGSLRVYLYFSGDMMGPFIENIVLRIKMPFGCGEQNIKSLTPSVFIARYLIKKNKMDQKIMDKVRQVSTAGVKKQREYLHQDGSYSAFGDRPNVCICGVVSKKRGSTWLTAYVLKTFSLLAQDDITAVSPDMLQKSFDYIRNNVTYNDCSYQYFVEEGELIHQEMMGGSSSRFGFVAFVLDAIMEYRKAALKAGLTESVQQADELIKGAKAWLQNQKDELLQLKEPYQLAIVAYVLARANEVSPDATSALLLAELEKVLKGEAKPSPVKQECVYSPSGGESKRCKSDANCGNYMECCQVACQTAGTKLCSRKPYRPFLSRDKEQQPEIVSVSSMIETKGYGLMAYLKLHEVETDDAKKNMYKMRIEELKKWLLSKRKANGFFSSTQDTVVALQALANYAMVFSSENDGTFRVTGKADGKIVADEVVVTKDQYTVTQERKLDIDTPPKSVSVVVSGSGTAYVNMVALYNVAKNMTKVPPYVVVIEPIKVDGTPVMRFCFKKNQDFKGKLGAMTVNSVEMISGYVATDVTAEQPTISELAPTKFEFMNEYSEVNIYYMVGDDDFAKDRCSHIYYKKNNQVEKPQPRPAIVRDYYNDENNVEVLVMALEQGPEIQRTTPTTTGASSAYMNMFLLTASIFVVVLARMMNSE